MNQLSTLGNAALYYASIGWHVFPCSPGTKIPIAKSNGVSDATTDATQIVTWWMETPNANIAVSPGPSGLVALDPDLYKPECGWYVWTHSNPAPDTLWQKSPRGGMHLVYKAHPGRSYARHIPGVSGVEIIKSGFYFMVSPSVVPEGQYEWQNPDHPIADAPEWLPTDSGQGSGRAVNDPLLLETKRAETPDEVARAMEAIDNDGEDWDHWNKVGMALWIATSGSDWGEKIWHDWSAKSEKYDPRETSSRWHHYAKSPPTSLGMGTLVHMAGGRKITAPAPPRINPDNAPTPFIEQQENYNAIPEINDPLLTPEEQAQFFTGCIAISGMGRIFTPRGDFLDAGRFNIEYGGHVFMLDDEKSTDEAWKAATRGRRFKLPIAQGACFRPDLGIRNVIEDELGRKKINTYIPANVRKVPGDISPFLEHIAKLLPDVRDQAILLNYAATLVQYPGYKFQWCPLVQGTMGNGKTVLLNCLEFAVGECYSHRPNADELADSGGKFTGWLRNKLLIGIEEIRVGDRNHMLEILKPMITNARLELQNKGVDQETGDNRANFFMCSNYKDAIPMDKDERRYAIFYSAQQRFEDLERDGMTGEYFPKLYEWLRGGGYEAIAYWLSTVQITDEFNPTTRAHRAPRTSSTAEVLKVSMGRVERLIMDCIEENLPGFRNGWISSNLVKSKLKEEGLNRIGPVALSKAYETLGYKEIGRFPRQIPSEAFKRPIVHSNLENPRLENYAIDQGYEISSPNVLTSS